MKKDFTRTLTLAVAAVLLLGAHTSAQLAAPNATGVAMGHLHFQVRDVDATRKFWVALGGRTVKVGAVDAVKLPDVLVLLSQGGSSGGSDASVVNHVAFRVRTFAEVEAAGFTVQRLQQFPGVGSITTPDGERIELFENAAKNLTFVPDTPPIDPVADRHNQPLAGPVAFHHIHLYVPAGAVAEAKSWYARLFGGTPGKRSNYDAVDLPGVNINISAAPKPVTGTAGRALDRIGFEVVDLAAFCRRLEAMKVGFTTPCGKDASGTLGATIVDPWGTVIALTEGFRSL
jgi:catechol 2,3-dioxygenase-like lactoylglutathione lyase family enzyme